MFNGLRAFHLFTMIKGDKKSERRIETAVKCFIEAETALITPVKASDIKVGVTTKFFRYQSLRKRLANRLRSKRNGTFYLKSDNDFLIILRIGDHTKETVEITIKHSDLCFEKV